MSRWRAEAAYVGRYIGAGGVNTLIGFAVIFLLLWLNASPLWANVGGYGVGLTLGFFASKKLVFRSKGHLTREGIRYLLAFAGAFLLNLLVLQVLIGPYGMPVVPAQVIASGSYTVAMYLLSRYVVFRA